MTIIDIIPTTRTAPPEAVVPDTISACMIIDLVQARLRDGRGPARSGAACHYRAPEGADAPAGTPCAVGALVTDDEYDPTWENRRVGVLVPSLSRWSLENTLEPGDVMPGLLPERLHPHRALLAELQDLHDTSTFWSGSRLNSYGEQTLVDIRQRYGCGPERSSEPDAEQS